ncbi:hypothetical protein J6590_072973, partial [Homalodisca vitripennis]
LAGKARYQRYLYNIPTSVPPRLSPLTRLTKPRVCSGIVVNAPVYFSTLRAAPVFTGRPNHL